MSQPGGSGAGIPEMPLAIVVFRSLLVKSICKDSPAPLSFPLAVERETINPPASFTANSR